MKKLSKPMESATRIKINDWLINLKLKTLK